MDNPNNRLITKDEVENILNYFENIGDDGTSNVGDGSRKGTFLKINNLEQTIKNHKKEDLIVISGSVPKNVTDDIYLEMAKILKPGMTTLQLDQLCKKIIFDNKYYILKN